ncbi:echinoderm microtubule-associated protein-like 6 [Nematostella vectensis]|uniref:echinoderm microtubule-associated protein-like 6 n=1 Tax=Nematostella vectensis TaxID=45351 RepID=UPI0020779B41|nr:echinoderm microtubule-associated protein-like 6 [Nematostella vectensis]
MFTREKNKVDPNKTKTGKRKGLKPAWETLLKNQDKAEIEEARQKGEHWRNRGGLSSDEDSEHDYDKYNTSVNSQLNLSGSLNRSASQGNGWIRGRSQENLAHNQSNGFASAYDAMFQTSRGSRGRTRSAPGHDIIVQQSNGFPQGYESIWQNNSRAARATSPIMDTYQESEFAPITEDFRLFPGQPPIPYHLVAKIQKGDYVNFQELLQDNLAQKDNSKKLIDDTERIEDVTKWIDCMACYIAILTHSRPRRIKDLLVYQSHIMRLYRDSPDKKAWQRYDVAYRRKASLNGANDWSNVDENLWILSCSPESRKAVTCRPCMSVVHDAKTCPYKNVKIETEERKKNMWGFNKSGKPSTWQDRPRTSPSPMHGLKKPPEGLELKFAFGYHGYNACNNLFYTQSNEMVFHVAALGIVYNKQNHQQRFYMGHTDDILCLTIHDVKDFVATGQVGRFAETHIWDATSMKTVSVLKGFHKRGIICVDFSGDGKKLADVGLDDDHSICIWDWRKEEKLATTRGHKDMIFVLEWNPFNPNHFVSVGEKHIKFWTHNDTKIDKRPVTFGKAGTAATMLCVCHSPIDDLCFAGSDTGHVYVWQNTTLRRTVPAHKGAVCSMYSMQQSKQEGYVTGGRDGVVVMWDKHFEQCLKAFKVEATAMNPGSVLLQNLPPIRAIHTDEDKILVGTGNDEIIEIGTDGMMTIVVQGHGEGEVWGLATHPSENECVTVSDDKTLRVWDLDKALLKKVKKMRKGGRAVTYSPDGGSIAVGQNDGGFLILEAKTLEKVVGYKDRKEEISDIKFSPDGKFLAVGSHDNYVDIYTVKRGKRIGVCSGSSSYITHLDWDVKGRLIQTNSGAREHLFYEAPRGGRKTLSAPAIERIDWATFTGVLGPCVKGVYPPGTDVTDVNATARTEDYKLLASGDDFGMVKLFEYPVSNRAARFHQYKGHSSHVTNVRWSHDDRVLVSTGGLDTSVLIWERVKAEDDDSIDVVEDKVFVQPKFMPTGPIKDPIAKGKPQF